MIASAKVTISPIAFRTRKTMNGGTCFARCAALLPIRRSKV